MSRVRTSWRVALALRAGVSPAVLGPTTRQDACRERRFDIAIPLGDGDARTAGGVSP